MMRVSAASFVRPVATEAVAGDACLVEPWARGVLVAAADGLGHGAQAAAAASAFLQCVRDAREAPLPIVLERAHRALLRGRGAVAAVARFDEPSRSVEVAGLGNVTVFIAGAPGEPKHVVLPAGVLGSAFRTIRPQVFGFGRGQVLVLHTDGVTSRFPLGPLRSLGPAAMAQAVVARHGKATDDAACIVAVAGEVAADSLPAPDGPESFTLAIRVRSDAECAAVAARAFAGRTGFGLKAQWQLGIAVSELVTNVLKFGLEGRLTLKFVGEPRPGIVAEVVDHGSGISDVDRARVDGFSEGALLDAQRPRRPDQGLGVGLGCVHRMMDHVAIDTGETGTRVVATKFRD